MRRLCGYCGRVAPPHLCYHVLVLTTPDKKYHLIMIVLECMKSFLCPLILLTELTKVEVVLFLGHINLVHAFAIHRAMS